VEGVSEDDTIHYLSLDTDVISVTDAGLAKALKEGTAGVIASTENGFTTTVTIVVKEN
jgi:uncharacterized protein YjdB